MTLAPWSWKVRAAALPTLPKPWRMTRLPSTGRPILAAAAAAVTKTPRPVASLRPKEPPRGMGFPVTTPGTVRPTFMEKVSIIQAISRSPVFTSGAGMSRSGPSRMPISEV
jgi:hypothetical protein